MKPYTYIIIDFACVIVPLVASFYKKYPFCKEWKYFLPANLIVAFAFIVWDCWFTKYKYWGFNPDYLTGIYILNLPIEEILFFVFIPYACVFTYFVLKKYIDPKYYNFSGVLPAYFLMAICLVSLVIYHDRMYTLLTALFLFITILMIKFKKTPLNFILFSYIIILPFFFLSNGILTGTFIEAPIVWYDNNENIGIRISTIPIEDIFYGFLLIVLNILLYERFKKSSLRQDTNLR